MGALDWTRELDEAVAGLARQALAEDHAAQDVTTALCVRNGQKCKAVIAARSEAVLAGCRTAEIVLRCFGAALSVRYLHEDGEAVAAGEWCVELQSEAAPMLSCERTILNIVQHLSGVATLTRRFVNAVKDCDVQIVDTRKTTPGWRLLEKYAVRCGGGINHRMHLADMIMIKDNHIALSGSTLAELVRRARKEYPEMPIACEADTLEQVRELKELDVDVVMLDNMTPDQVREAVSMCAGCVCLEVTGGVTLSNVREYAETGVQRISIGALTHSAPSVDIGLDILPL